MNFFQVQDRARHSTAWLLVLFAVAVGMLIALVYAAVHFVLLNAGDTTFALQDNYTINYELLFVVGGGVLLVVVAGSLFRGASLTSGGYAVADSLNGRAVLRSTQDPKEKQLRNIVEEMAIASGVPVPAIFIIPEKGINAFAAGTSINNAVIGVTEGALIAFTRDEMQGVIAHEYSHILNGDMRLNIRLITTIYGIAVLGVIGSILLRAPLFMRSSNDRGAGALMIALFVAGLALIIAGYIGTFFGSWIRAAVSRQREYLADASAVQFTRNPYGIAAALEKIGMRSGQLEQPASSEYSHMFFASGAAGFNSFFSNPFASHPPVKKRIATILPMWDGKSRIGKESPDPHPTGNTRHSRASGNPKQDDMDNAQTPASQHASATATQKLVPIAELFAQIGMVAAATKNTPPSLHTTPIEKALEDSYSARALIYAMVIFHTHHTQQEAQLMQLLARHTNTHIYGITQQLLPHLEALPRSELLTIVQQAVPTLRQLSPKQYEQFAEVLTELVNSDETLSLFEWCLQAIIIHALNDCFHINKSKEKKIPLQISGDDYAYALSVLAQCDSQHEPQQAFAAGTAAFPPTLAQKLNYISDGLNPERLFAVLQRIAALRPKAKEQFVRACLATAAHNNQLTDNETLLLRAYLLLLDIPIPA